MQLICHATLDGAKAAVRCIAVSRPLCAARLGAAEPGQRYKVGPGILVMA